MSWHLSFVDNPKNEVEGGLSKTMKLASKLIAEAARMGKEKVSKKKERKYTADIRTASNANIITHQRQSFQKRHECGHNTTTTSKDDLRSHELFGTLYRHLFKR